MAKIYTHYKLKCKFLLIGLCCAGIISAQDFSNKGLEFWTAYGTHLAMLNPDGTVNSSGGSQEMVFYVTGNQDAVITIEIPALGWSKTYNYSQNSLLTTDEMPKSGAADARILQEGLSQKGIHITSTAAIAVFCHIYDSKSSATTLLTPVNSLGQFYTTLNFTQLSSSQYARGYCFIVGTEDSTQVEITPSVNTLTHAAGVPFLVDLNKGDVFTLYAAPTGQVNGLYSGGDLTGTQIRTVNINANVPCRKVAVFCGASDLNINCNGGNMTGDVTFQQILPNGTWGNKFFLVPTKKMENNYYRVLVKDTATLVHLNGTLLTNLINGMYYEFNVSSPSEVNSNLPVMMAQYITATGECTNFNGGDGDPEMVYLTPLALDINSAVFESPALFGIVSHFVNVVIGTRDTSNFTLDGDSLGYQFRPFPMDADYSYARFELEAGKHSIKADTGLNALVYGYGPEESYGYNPGFSLRRLSNYLTVYNPYATPSKLVTCRNTDFKLSLTIVYQPMELTWSFSNAADLTPNTDIYIKDPVPDSIFQQGENTYYRYSLPNIFSFTSLDSFHVHIRSLAPIQDGCINEHLMDFDVKVVERPVAQWSLDYDHCSNDSLYFRDSSLAFSNKSVQWNWDFGDGTTSTDQNVYKKYAAYGDYNVSLRTITDIGCFDDTAHIISRDPVPVADFNFTGFFCLDGNNLKFTDASTISPGSIISWLWNFGDGTIDSTQNPVKYFSAADTFDVRLIVRSNKDCYDTSLIQQVRIYPNPGIEGPSMVSVFLGDTIRLPMTYTGNNLAYLWSPNLYLDAFNVPQPVSKPLVDILYTVNVNGEGNCSSSKQIFVEVVKQLKIPNAFSPNGDGINDKWIITGLETFPDNKVEVFNRYGQVIFSVTGYDNAGKVWDGTLNGKPMPVGTYYYIINPNRAIATKKSGWIAILR